MTSSWLSEFKSLAARKAKLVRVVAVDYGDPSEPILDPLWLRFADSPWLRLCGGPSGQGLSLDEEPPREEEFEADSAAVIRDLSGEPPLAAVVDIPLEAVGLITWPIPLEDEGPSVDFPVGIRLQFEKGEAWILNVGDQIDLFDTEPPFWGDPDYSLSQWSAEDERWGEGDVPSDLPPRWWFLATPVDLPSERVRLSSLLKRLLRR